MLYFTYRLIEFNLLLWSIEFLRNSLSAKEQLGWKFLGESLLAPAPFLIVFRRVFDIRFINNWDGLKTKFKRHLIQFHTNVNANRSHFMIWFQSLDDVFWDGNLLLGAIQRNGVKIFYAEGLSIFRFFFIFWNARSVPDRRFLRTSPENQKTLPPS